MPDEKFLQNDTRKKERVWFKTGGAILDKIRLYSDLLQHTVILKKFSLLVANPSFSVEHMRRAATEEMTESSPEVCFRESPVFNMLT